MALISMRQMLDHAAEFGYGVPAFNVNNLEQMRAIMEAADKTDSPVIVQASAGARKYAGAPFLRHLILAAIEEFPHIPVCMHQDQVQAGPLRAQVRDTDFAVRYLDGEAQVRVQRGDVDLQAASDQHIRLSAGDSISVGPQGFGQRQRPDMRKDLAWVEGRLVFENCPLSQVLAEVRRYYPGWIINRNGHLDDMAVTGNYRLDQPLETLRALAHITSAQLHEYPAVVILN